MPDPRRLESLQSDDPERRGGRIEALLVEGLDHYLAGRYDHAIHIWTRVLFLDRSHAGARRYIDRARTALAERQRRADELLARASSHVDEGDAQLARELLTGLPRGQADDERTAAVWRRLERLEHAQGIPRAARRVSAAVVDAVPLRPGRRAWSRRSRATAAIVMALVCVGIAARSRTVRGWFAGTAGEPLAPRSRMTLPVLSSSEAALVRARTLYARGRLAEALHALDRVPPGSADRPAADALRVELQQLLLSARRGSLPAPPSGEADRP
jgi:tetratricopeptide (TPR) repeat protein